ncbi:MAG TPA: cell division topological specificity factor MinE [Stellaceae bacterium]|jgi:cell division topological specificity factor|nr:cell division topological specificity factor MinE [Stellaceae bacterium]
MGFFSSLFRSKPTSASIAKERLKIVLAHERASNRAPDFLPVLQKELLAVVGRYIEISDDGLRVTLGGSGDTSTLEINIEIEGGKLKKGGSGPALSAAV